jgi:hypothetical protein
VDKATELKGTLTHWVMGMDRRVFYLFQPYGLDDKGEPIGKLSLEMERLNLKPTDFEMVDVPVEILGSIVTDKASGFTGMAIDFVRHVNGCFHVAIQPKGILAKTKEPVKKCEFDLRGCKGKQIDNPTGTKLEESKRDKPSPDGDGNSCRRMPINFGKR